MTERHDGPGVPTAADYAVGGDADEPGFSQPITLDDMEALAHSARGSLEARRETLKAMVGELEVRRSIDRGNEMDPLIARGRELLSALSAEGTGEGDPEAYGLAPEDRLTRPDEIIERREEEAREERGEAEKK
ncbi:hypothetical protein [Afifella sp. IM 167]|uniref:hypothetical protein n=1 Tax=Afifella sp. IM 167 TaxID=2033586 RepID=UPI001CC94FFD|nr:hypothetical protein [Afifella sp. IM 167]MBZ8135281.1 hypothetical protein [Afifella sp. IM 167]